MTFHFLSKEFKMNVNYVNNNQFDENRFFTFKMRYPNISNVLRNFKLLHLSVKLFYFGFELHI